MNQESFPYWTSNKSVPTNHAIRYFMSVLNKWNPLMKPIAVWRWRSNRASHWRSVSLGNACILTYKRTPEEDWLRMGVSRSSLCLRPTPTNMRFRGCSNRLSACMRITTMPCTYITAYLHLPCTSKCSHPRDWVMPMPRHSSSSKILSKPESSDAKYRLGMSLSICLGRITCRYSNLSSESIMMRHQQRQVDFW